MWGRSAPSCFRPSACRQPSENTAVIESNVMAGGIPLSGWRRVDLWSESEEQMGRGRPASIDLRERMPSKRISLDEEL
jgi:hypothetical protein